MEQLVGVLEEKRGELAFSLEEPGGYNGEPVYIEVDTQAQLDFSQMFTFWIRCLV